MSQWGSVEDLANSVRAGRITAVSLVNRALETIKAKKEFSAVISVIEDRAKQRAMHVDQTIKSGGQAGRLAGVPFIAKDNMLTLGSETTAASNILKGFESPYQATVIERIEAEGGICVAKSNLDAFGHGASTENSDFMVTTNPHDKARVPGGSSGGSAAAVILDMAPFALGTDTGGSIRLPASFCGAVGYKPTYGLVSRSGIIAMASSTDVVGPLTKTVSEAAYILDIISGEDDLDSTTIERDKTPYTNLKRPIKGAKIGVIEEYLTSGTDSGVRKVISGSIDLLRKNGALVEKVSLPSLSLALACYYIICPAEISSNLSRYDGQRYGYSSSKASTLDESYNWSRSEGFGNEAKRRIMIGTYVLSSGYYDAYYKQAQRLRTRLIDEFDTAFKQYDFLVGPVSPTPAFNVGQNTNDPLSMYLTDIMTVSASLVGIPAVSVPAGESDKLPVGLQIMAAQRQDRELLGIAWEVEGLLA